MSWVPCPYCTGYVALIDPDDADEQSAERQPNRARNIPSDELRRVAGVLSSAAQSALSGSETLGYASLIRELARAEELVAAGVPWAEDLLARWRDAIDRFGACLREEDDEIEPDCVPSARH